MSEVDLETISVKDRVIELIEKRGFVGLWRMRGEIYEETIREMIATFVVKHDKERCGIFLEARLFQ